MELPLKPRQPDSEEESFEEEYLILQCPACEKDVKVPTDSLGVRMGCPYCREPLEIAESEPEKEEKKKGKYKPRALRPLVFRQLRDDDISFDSPYEFADETGRRRLPFEPPLWDDGEAAGDSSPEARDGETQKMHLTRKEQNFRTVKIIILSIAIATAAVIGYLGLVQMVRVVGQDHKTVLEEPGKVKEKMAERRAEETEAIPRFLTSDEERAALAVVNGFLNAESIEERLTFVRDPERVEPLMREWYARSDALIAWPDGNILLRDKRVDLGRYFIRLAIDFVGIGSRMFIVEQTETEFKLDWETATGYQPVPLLDFKTARPEIPVQFRAKLKKSDYYNRQFVDRERYYAVDLSYPGNIEFNLIGYIDRSRDWAAELIKSLEAGLGPSLIVELKYPDGKVEDDRQVEIISIVSYSWWL